MGSPGGSGVLPSRALIIEDDPNEAQAPRDLLVWNRFEVALAATARQGWSRLRSWDPDAVVLDRDLPDADGLTLCRAIQLDAQPRDLSVLILAGRSAVREPVKGRRARAEDRVAKPYDPREVLTRLQALPRQGQHIASLKTYHLQWWNFLKAFIPSAVLRALQKAPREAAGPARMRPLRILALRRGRLRERLCEAAQDGRLPVGTLGQARKWRLGVFRASIHAEGGSPSPVVGKVTMVRFNIPLSRPDHAARALRAPLVLRERICRLHSKLPLGLRFVRGILLRQGNATAGLMEGSGYRHYRPLGEAVEVARRPAMIAPPGDILLAPVFYEAFQSPLPVQPWTEAPTFLRTTLYRVSTGSPPPSTEKGTR
jgi:DNA-binding response OmpR family regulator